mgnify:CR=1 FL=1
MRRSAKGHPRPTRMLPRHDVVLTGEQAPDAELMGLSTVPALGLFGYAWNAQRQHRPSDVAEQRASRLPGGQLSVAAPTEAAPTAVVVGADPDDTIGRLRVATELRAAGIAARADPSWREDRGIGCLGLVSGKDSFLRWRWGPGPFTPHRTRRSLERSATRRPIDGGERSRGARQVRQLPRVTRLPQARGRVRSVPVATGVALRRAELQGQLLDAHPL